jgi:hypothetical protein
MHYIGTNLINSIPRSMNNGSDLNLNLYSLRKKIDNFKGYTWIIIILVIVTFVLTFLVILLITGVLGKKSTSIINNNGETIDTSKFVTTDKALQTIDGQLNVERLTSGGVNILLGQDSGKNQDNTNIGNIFIGAASGLNDTSGQANTFIGSYSGLGITSGNNNTFIGNGSGGQITDNSSNNIIIGSLAGPVGTISNSFWIRSGMDKVVTTDNSYYILGYNPSTGRIIPIDTGSNVAYVPV